MLEEEKRALIELLIMHIDDCAGNSSPDDLEQLAEALAHVANAARHRANAVHLRLGEGPDNEIYTPKVYEDLSEHFIRLAKKDLELT